MNKTSLTPSLGGKRLYLTYDFAQNFRPESIFNSCRNLQLTAKGVVNSKGLLAHSYSGTVRALVGQMHQTTFLLTPTGLGGLTQNLYTHYLDVDCQHLAFCQHRGMAVFSHPQLGTYTKEWDLEEVNQSSSRGFDSIASLGERVWGIDGRVLYATALSTEVDWQNGLSITLPSPCSLLAVWDNRLYAFGEQLYQIEVSSITEDITVRHLGSYGNAVSVINSPHNGRLYFATLNALYVVTPNGAQAVMPLPGGLSKVCLASNGSIIYLNLGYSKGQQTHLIAYDIAQDAVKAVSLAEVQDILYTDSLLAVQNGALASFVSSYSYSTVTASGLLPLPGKRYYLRNLYLTTKYDLQLTITTDKGSYSYLALGRAGVQAIPLCGKCTEVSVTAVGSVNIELTHLALEVVSYEI